MARFRAVLLLTLAPLMLLGGVDVHTGYAAAAAETPVFSDARHGGQSSHCEAAGTVRSRHCPACLLTTQYHGLSPRPAAGAQLFETGTPMADLPSTPPRSAAHRPARPRAPPSR